VITLVSIDTKRFIHPGLMSDKKLFTTTGACQISQSFTVDQAIPLPGMLNFAIAAMCPRARMSEKFSFGAAMGDMPHVSGKMAASGARHEARFA